MRSSGRRFIKFDYEFNVETIKSFTIIKAAINLFKALNFIHENELSLNGKIKFENIVFEVCFF